MRFIVTGGAGFVGSHLADRLLTDGHHVTVIDNLLTGNIENIRHNLTNPKFEFIHHDIINPLQVSGEVDGIFHMASPASPIDYLKYPIETLKVGSYGTHNVLELAVSKKAGLLLASTSEVYGDPLEHPQRETYFGHVNSIGVRSVYDEAKRYAEAAVMAYHRTHGLKTRIVRIFNTYGPRMRLDDGRVVPNFIQQALTGNPLTIYGDGSQTRCFQYVDDLIEGLIRLYHSDFAEPINIGTTRELSVKQFAEVVIKVSGNSAGIIFKDERIKDDPQQRKPDTTRALEILDWEPRVELEDGLKRTFDYFRQAITK